MGLWQNRVGMEKGLIVIRYNGPKLAYPELEAVTTEKGRVYTTPTGPAPSVTTILSKLPHPELDAWKERVGEDEAKRISTEATNIGTAMHNLCESFITKEPYKKTTTDELEEIAEQMFRKVKMYGLRRVTEVFGIEVCLHLDNLVAGRTDLIGIEDGKFSIMDYKTSKFFKKESEIENYFIQLGFYVNMHEFMFPEHKFEQGVLFIGTRPNPAYNKTADIQVVRLDKVKLEYYKNKALDTIEWYYQNFHK